MRNTVHSALLTSLLLAAGPVFSQSGPDAPPVSAQAAPAATVPTGTSKAVTKSDTAKPAPAAVAPADTARTADTATASVPAAPADTAAAAPAPAVDTAASAAPAPASAPTATGDAPAAQVSDTATAEDAAPTKRKRRPRIVKETTVNTIDELKGRYRSPKKALFMSLVVPGLGQAYVGQHWGNYARGAAYFLTDVGLILGWRHYVHTKQDRQIARYRRHADEFWLQSRYEDSIQKFNSTEFFDRRNSNRVAYCQAVQSNEGTAGNRLYQGCLEPDATDNSAYQSFHNEFDELRDGGWSVDSVGRFREKFPNTHNFYELIGKEVEFITGWQDAGNIIVGDSTFTMLDEDGEPVPASTPLQQEYIAMRAKANDYARMQAWFLGGMVLNHIVSALDAALAAHFHNKSLYQTDLGWWDKLRLDSHIAWERGAPRPTVSASVTF